MALPATHLEYHVARMDCASRAQDVMRMVAKLPGARHIRANIQTRRLHLELDETQTPRCVLESNLLLLGYGARALPTDNPLGNQTNSLDPGDALSLQTLLTVAGGEAPSPLNRPAAGEDALRSREAAAAPAARRERVPVLRSARRTSRWGGVSASTWLAALLILAAALATSAARTWRGGAGHPPHGAAALTTLAVAAGLLLVAALFARRRAHHLAWLLSWLAAVVLGDTVGTLLDRAAERLLAAAHLAPQAHRLGGAALGRADLADLLVLGGGVGLLLTLGRRGTLEGPGGDWGRRDARPRRP